jgi:F0F1-type ATP synthase assembly protein I
MADNRREEKPENGSGFFLARAAKALQENVTRAGPVAVGSYTLLGAIILLGGIGYVVDRWLGTSPWLLLAGLLLGLVVGFYELAKAVWPR